MTAVGISPTSISISWSPPADDRGIYRFTDMSNSCHQFVPIGTAITGYTVVVSGTGPSTSVTLGPDAREYIASGLSPSTIYSLVHINHSLHCSKLGSDLSRVSVTASNSAGESSPVIVQVPTLPVPGDDISFLYQSEVHVFLTSSADISLSTDYVSVREDGVQENMLFISLRGSLSEPVPVILRPFTFSQYQSFRSNFSSSIGQEAPDLSTTFPQLPDPATATDDFNQDLLLDFLVTDGTAPIMVSIGSLVVNDTEAEFTEGFVLFMEVLYPDPRDRGSISVTNSLVLIGIEDNDRMSLTSPLLFYLVTLCLCLGPLVCDVTGEVIDSVAAFDCDGAVPPNILNIECLLDDTISFDCESSLPNIPSIAIILRQLPLAVTDFQTFAVLLE